MDKILKQFGKEKIEQVVLKSNSFVEATSLLGLKPFQKKNVERSIKRLNLSVQHFDSVQRVKDSKIRYTKEKLEILVKKCKNYKEILSELDILPISTNYTMLKKKLREFEIDFSHLKNQKRTDIKANWSKENLQLVISNSKTQKEILENMAKKCWW